MAPLWSAGENRALLNAWRDSVDPHTHTKSLYVRFVDHMGGRSDRTEIGVLARRDALKFMWLLITEFHRAEEESEVQRSWFALPVWEKRAVFGKKTNGRMNGYVEVQHDTFVVLDAILSTVKRRRTASTGTSYDSASTRGFVASRGSPAVLATEPTEQISSSSSSQQNPIVLQSAADDSGSSTESDEDFVALGAIPSLRRAAASASASQASPPRRQEPAAHHQHTDASAAQVLTSPPRHKRRKLTLSRLSVEDTVSAPQSSPRSDSLSPRREEPTAHSPVSDGVQPQALVRSTILETRQSALSIASLLSSNDTAITAVAPEPEPVSRPREPASPATVSTSEDEDDDVPTTASSASSRSRSAMALSQSLQAPTDRAVYAPLSSNASMSFILPAPLKRDSATTNVDPTPSRSGCWPQCDGRRDVGVVEFIALIEAQAKELQALYRDYQHHKQLEDAAQQTFKALVERDQRDQQHVLQVIRALDASVAQETGPWTSERSQARGLSQGPE